MDELARAGLLDDELLGDFLAEAAEGLEVLDRELLRLERDASDPALVATIFRAVHSLKGACGFLKLSRLEALAHALESVLGKLRDGKIGLAAGAGDTLFLAVDRIKLVVAALGRGEGEPTGADADVIARLNAIASGMTASDPDVTQAGPPPATDDRDLPADAGDPDPAGWADSLGAGSKAAGNANANASIRVRLGLLESLMTSVSELVLTRNQLLQIQRLSGEPRFALPLQRLSALTSELHEGIVRTRMQPIRVAWSGLPRMVRDLAGELGKQIDLVMEGADTELDRHVLEVMRDPLTHMVRNAADHGLEPSAVRVAAGKPARGTVSLKAWQDGGQIVVSIADDGKGLDRHAIEAKAVALGFAPPGELAVMPDEELFRFIFRPGFSTASQVSAISGRGVGLDVVLSNVQSIGGTIEVRSTLGRGTSFILRFPLTLAIVQALIVGAGGQRFALPQVNVLELVRVTPRSEARLEQLDDALFLRLRDRVVPTLALGRLLGLPEPPVERKVRQVAVARLGAETFGIAVDEVYDTEEIVVKPLAPALGHIGYYAGNTILGDGSVIIILDAAGIAEQLRRDGAAGLDTRDAAPAAPAVPDAGERLLLFLGSGGVQALPLSCLLRLDEHDVSAAAWTGGCGSIAFGGRPLALLLPPGVAPASSPTGRRPLLLLQAPPSADAEALHFAIVAERILDIVAAEARLEPVPGRTDLLGQAIVDGRVVPVLDPAALAHSLRAGPAGAARDDEEPAALVITDSIQVRAAVAAALEPRGYRVAGAASAREAMALHAAGRDFAAIVIDLLLPETDGASFARAVAALPRWSSTPLAVLAAPGRAGRAETRLPQEARICDRNDAGQLAGILLPAAEEAAA